MNINQEPLRSRLSELGRELMELSREALDNQSEYCPERAERIAKVQEEIERYGTALVAVRRWAGLHPITGEKLEDA